MPELQSKVKVWLILENGASISTLKWSGAKWSKAGENKRAELSDITHSSGA